jgi:drug/metabolite transporter (DMT)-like permease
LCHHLGWQALLGIFCLASGVLFYGWSIKASLYAAQSVVTIQFVGTLLLFRERIEMRQWFGIALIVIGFSPVVRQIG